MGEEEYTTVKFSPSATKELMNMKNHVLRIGEFWGRSSEEYTNASESLLQVIFSINSLGGTVWKDSDLCLMGSNDFIQYGVIFHPDRENRTKVFGTHNEYVYAGDWSVHS